MATPSAPPVYSRLHEFESLSEEEKEQRIARVATNRKARPQMPRLPLFTGWGAFLGGPGVVARWLVLSAWLSAAAALALFAFNIIFAGGPYGAVAGLPLFCAAAAVAALCGACFAAMAITIVTESSEGNNRITAWPTINPIDWFGETLYLMVAGLASAAPGYVLVQITGAPPLAVLAGMLVSAWLLFPILLLSQLEGSSPFALAMPGVLGSLGKRLGTWGTFYLITGGLLAGTAALVVLMAQVGGTLLLVASLPLVGAAFAYFRLLGRLAWRVREDS